jgi:L-threonylcarbamoyladenylate synthase
VSRAVGVEEAAALLQDGELVGIPTETVYGLAAMARRPLALRQVFARKGRPVDHPLIVHLPDAAALEAWARPGPAARALADALGRAFWPGPLTLVLPRAPGVPDELTGGRDTVAVRIPAHPLAQALLRALGDGLAAPSANRFGRVSPTCAADVWAELGEGLPVLDGGPCALGLESTIVDLSPLEAPGGRPALLRPGALPVEALLPLTGPLGESATPAPGTHAAHYAPRTSLLLSADAAAEAEALRARGLRVAVLPVGELPDRARGLYAALRALDASGADVLVAALAPEEGLGRAINDRLRRAARGAGVTGSSATPAGALVTGGLPNRRTPP